MPTPDDPARSERSITTPEIPWSYSWPAASVRKPTRVTRMLLRKPRTLQLRIVTPERFVSTGVLTSMPTPFGEALLTSASRQSSVTLDAVISNPPRYVHEGSRTLLTVTVTRSSARAQGISVAGAGGGPGCRGGHRGRHAGATSATRATRTTSRTLRMERVDHTDISVRKGRRPPAAQFVAP